MEFTTCLSATQALGIPTTGRVQTCFICSHMQAFWFSLLHLSLFRYGHNKPILSAFLAMYGQDSAGFSTIWAVQSDQASSIKVTSATMVSDCLHPILCVLQTWHVDFLIKVISATMVLDCLHPIL